MKKWGLLGVIAVFVAIPVAFWAWTLTGGLPFGAYLYSAGRLLALVGFILAFFQFVLSSKIRWLERDIGLDRLFSIHKTSGLIGLTFVLLHPIPLFLSDVIYGVIPAFTPLKFVGLVSLLIFVIAVGSAILYGRLHLKYETWKRIHWASYVALPLGFIHSLLLGSDLARPPLRACWLILAGLYGVIWAHKLWRWVRVRKHPYRVVKVVQETHDTWSLHFEGPRVDYKPGQFLIIWLVRDGQTSEPHPFTISSSPTSDRLSISVKSVGDFTARVGDTRLSDRAYVDAPYGVFSFLNHNGSDLVFIAGGIGITPFVSMLRYMRDERLVRNVLLIWGNKTERDIAFRDELAEMIAEMPSLRVVHVMSNQDDWPGERGYVDTVLLQRYMEGVEDPQVFVCGPPMMMALVIKALLDLGVSKRRIHYERFALR